MVGPALSLLSWDLGLERPKEQIRPQGSAYCDKGRLSAGVCFGFCGGLNESGPCRLVHLHASVPVSQTVQEGLEGVALLEMCHWGGLGDFKSQYQDPVSFFRPATYGSGTSSSVPLQPCLPACCHAPHTTLTD